MEQLISGRLERRQGARLSIQTDQAMVLLWLLPCCPWLGPWVCSQTETAEMLSYLPCLHECRFRHLTPSPCLVHAAAGITWGVGSGTGGGENLSLTLAVGIKRFKNLFGGANGSCLNSKAPRTTLLPCALWYPAASPNLTSTSWVWVVTEWSSLPPWPHPG